MHLLLRFCGCCPAAFQMQPLTHHRAEISEVTENIFLPWVSDTPLPVWEPLPFPDVE